MCLPAAWSWKAVIKKSGSHLEKSPFAIWIEAEKPVIFSVKSNVLDDYGLKDDQMCGSD